jgi:hypothetical protein
MKKLSYMLLGSGMALVMLASAGAQDSLGDIARRARMQKAATSGVRVYDNDNLPRQGDLGTAVVTGGNAPAAADAKAAADSKPTAKGSSANAANTPAAAGADAQKSADEWSGKIADQKKQIAQLERELNVLVRESQIRATVYYADAGTRLRDQQKFSDDTRKSNDDIAAKTKELEDAKQKLDDMQEQARKAGVPAADRE